MKKGIILFLEIEIGGGFSSPTTFIAGCGLPKILLSTLSHFSSLFSLAATIITLSPSLFVISPFHKDVDISSVARDKSPNPSRQIYHHYYLKSRHQNLSLRRYSHSPHFPPLLVYLCLH